MAFQPHLYIYKPKTLSIMQTSIFTCDTGLASYRLNSLDEIKTLPGRFGKEKIEKLWTTVKFNLSQMQHRQTFNYQRYFDPEDIEPVIKLCCYYITKHPDYEFLDDYSAIRRL